MEGSSAAQRSIGAACGTLASGAPSASLPRSGRSAPSLRPRRSVAPGARLPGGAKFQNCKDATATNPVRAAMISYEGRPDKSRFSWDPLTTLIAVRGAAAGGCSETGAPGANQIDPTTGANKWVPDKGINNQSYLLLHDAQSAGDAIDALLCQAPKRPM